MAKPLKICPSTPSRAGPRAFVKIEDGCDRFCAYCVIPRARGRVRSKPLDALQSELQALAARGYREIVLVGINLTAYGKDTGADLCDAVEAACAVDGIDRVRLGSLEPDCLTPAVIDRLASPACAGLCPQFHLSLQSGCDATLSRMRRRYTTDEYRQVCQHLRAAFPGCALTTDVMVGFPGESQAEFELSRRFVEEIGFARVHVFAYSRRAGTPAATAPGQISRAEKARGRRLCPPPPRQAGMRLPPPTSAGPLPCWWKPGKMRATPWAIPPIIFLSGSKRRGIACPNPALSSMCG